MVKSVNQHYRPIDQEVNDKVYLSTKNLKSYRPSRKLISQQEGPFTILKKKGNAYKLDLPASSKIYPYFAPDVLIKAPQDPLPGQENPNPSGDVIEGVEEWEVSEILAVRQYKGILQYRVSWLGHDPDPTWYNASNFMGAPHKLKAFHEAYPAKPGPPRKLQEWITAWESGSDNYDHLTDDRVVGKTGKH